MGKVRIWLSQFTCFTSDHLKISNAQMLHLQMYSRWLNTFLCWSIIHREKDHQFLANGQRKKEFFCSKTFLWERNFLSVSDGIPFVGDAREHSLYDRAPVLQVWIQLLHYIGTKNNICPFWSIPALLNWRPAMLWSFHQWWVFSGDAILSYRDQYCTFT